MSVSYFELSISNTNIYDRNMPLLTLGYYPENDGEHYVSTEVSDTKYKHSFITNTNAKVDRERDVALDSNNPKTNHDYCSDSSFASSASSQTSFTRRKTVCSIEDTPSLDELPFINIDESDHDSHELSS